jgi:hypothetical protein
MRKKLVAIAALIIVIAGLHVQAKRLSSDLIKSNSFEGYQYFPVFRLSIGSVPFIQ